MESNNSHNTRNSQIPNNNTKIVCINFCPPPLDKQNIIKINIDIDDSLKLKEILHLGLRTFNAAKQTNFTLHEETYLFKIRLSKKSGLPDMDLPSLNENLTLKDLNHTNLSIVLEDSHLILQVGKPNKKYEENFDAMSMISFSSKGKKQNGKAPSPYSTSDSNNKDKQKELSEKLLNVEQKKGCCYCFMRIFKMNK
jgi:hypothetical protein